MLAFLLDGAAARGVRQISLETGTAGFFDPVRTLYGRTGFVECGPFGRYRADPHSVFMTMTPVVASRLSTPVAR